jgi:hypothetical protein
MGEDVKGIESPIELLRHLIEESGKWTKDLVRFAWTLLVAFMSILPLFLYSYIRSIQNYLADEGPIFPVIIGIPLAVYMAWVFRILYRQYKAQIRRRDNWSLKFEMLKKKEEEIERLLSEGAG